jgi:hypothetical protein
MNRFQNEVLLHLMSLPVFDAVFVGVFIGCLLNSRILAYGSAPRHERRMSCG